MAYVRGNAADYDDWEALGNPGWSYREVWPYFKRSEHNEDIFNEYYGQDGELNVCFQKAYRTPYGPAFVKACIEKGFASNPDYNGARQEGTGMFQFTIRKGGRHSGAAAFLNPGKKCPNLTILTHARVRKVFYQPKSRGVVALSSANPADLPRIQPDFLEAEADRLVLLEGARTALEILQANAFAAYLRQIIGLKPTDSDDVLFLHIQKFLETVYHPVGTCKMGRDEMAIVDVALRVRGVEGCRCIHYATDRLREYQCPGLYDC